jgi:predicted nucleotidyltransferase
MNIKILLSTVERIKILSQIIYKTEHLSVNKVAKNLKLSKGLISKYFDFLVKEGILKRSAGKFLVQNNVQTKAIKILLNLNIFDTDFFKKYKFVKSAGVYGSFVKGTNTEDSDIDLWLLIDSVNEENLAKLTNGLKKMFGNVKPLYLTEEKIQLLKKNDTTFYHSLIFGSITIYGDGIEAI